MATPILKETPMTSIEFLGNDTVRLNILGTSNVLAIPKLGADILSIMNGIATIGLEPVAPPTVVARGGTLKALAPSDFTNYVTVTGPCDSGRTPTKKDAEVILLARDIDDLCKKYMVNLTCGASINVYQSGPTTPAGCADLVFNNRL